MRNPEPKAAIFMFTHWILFLLQILVVVSLEQLPVTLTSKTRQENTYNYGDIPETFQKSIFVPIYVKFKGVLCIEKSTNPNLYMLYWHFHIS